jgi:hypothetical protein
VSLLRVNRGVEKKGVLSTVPASMDEAHEPFAVEGAD